MKFWKEFKAFIAKGNIVDLAVAVVIGTAFNKIVTSLVNDIIMPLITWALGASSLAGLSIVLKTNELGEATLVWAYGNFIQAIIDFLIIALTIFVVLKLMMKSGDLLKEATHFIKKPTKEEKAYLKENGVNLKDKQAVQEALAAYHAKLDAEKAAAEAEKKAAEFKQSTEGLLTEIRDLLLAEKTGNAAPSDKKDEESAESTESSEAAENADKRD